MGSATKGRANARCYAQDATGLDIVVGIRYIGFRVCWFRIMRKIGRETGQFLPLSPAALHILLALAGADLHGYGIMQEIARQSAGQYKIGPGTLYDNLKKLVNQGLLEETSKRGPRGVSGAPSKDA